VFLLALSILSGSQVIYGVTIAGLVSSLRQLIWLKRIPKIEKDDALRGIANSESTATSEKVVQ
jgi:hypothetical protein